MRVAVLQPRMTEPKDPKRKLPERRFPVDTPDRAPDEQSGEEAENQILREEVTNAPPPAKPPLRKDVPPGS